MPDKGLISKAYKRLAWNPEPLPRDTVTPKVGTGQASDHHGGRRVETQPSGIWVFVVVNALE